MKNLFLILFFSLSSTFLFSCSELQNKSELSITNAPKGSLLIIGGGSRPNSMIDRIIAETSLQDSGYAVVLTMSGFDPDTSAFYGERQFRDAGISNIRSYDFERRQSFSEAASDSLINASLIYITGGSQSRFMDSIIQTPAIAEALKNAYQDGTMISGTSAGAAVMSKIMITGDQHNYPEYTSTYYNLEKDNMITAEGLGLITDVIIDQHFVKRARNNRLLTAIMDYPNHTGIGIDESTAILVKDGKAEVVGNSQVLVYKNAGQTTSTYGEKIGGKNLRLDIYLPGEIFDL
ncbi:MAG: cyanophycinase [Balneolaceae bacterium]